MKLLISGCEPCLVFPTKYPSSLLYPGNPNPIHRMCASPEKAKPAREMLLSVPGLTSWNRDAGIQGGDDDAVVVRYLTSLARKVRLSCLSLGEWLVLLGCAGL